jgi:hypothetical protein
MNLKETIFWVMDHQGQWAFLDKENYHYDLQYDGSDQRDLLFLGQRMSSPSGTIPPNYKRIFQIRDLDEFLSEIRLLPHINSNLWVASLQPPQFYSQPGFIHRFKFKERPVVIPVPQSLIETVTKDVFNLIRR